MMNNYKRSGKWTQEEEQYAVAIINAFHDGTLDIHADSEISLRRYLAKKLMCSPKRISKKYESSGYNGKVLYSRNDAATNEMIRATMDKLRPLEARFRSSINTPKKSEDMQALPPKADDAPLKASPGPLKFEAPAVCTSAEAPPKPTQAVLQQYQPIRQSGVAWPGSPSAGLPPQTRSTSTVNMNSGIQQSTLMRIDALTAARDSARTQPVLPGSFAGLMMGGTHQAPTAAQLLAAGGLARGQGVENQQAANTAQVYEALSLSRRQGSTLKALQDAARNSRMQLAGPSAGLQLAARLTSGPSLSAHAQLALGQQALGFLGTSSSMDTGRISNLQESLWTRLSRDASLMSSTGNRQQILPSSGRNVSDEIQVQQGRPMFMLSGASNAPTLGRSVSDELQVQQGRPMFMLSGASNSLGGCLPTADQKRSHEMTLEELKECDGARPQMKRARQNP